MATPKSSVELYRQLKEAIGEKSADAIVVFLDHFLREEGVTKSDLNVLKVDFEKLRTDFEKLRTDFEKLRTDFEKLRTDFEHFKVEMIGEISKVKISIIKWMVGLMLGLVATMTTIFVVIVSYLK